MLNKLTAMETKGNPPGKYSDGGGLWLHKREDGGGHTRVGGQCFVHQDFTATGAGPMIEIYANRVEISNPGKPIVPVERFIDGYQSRNEKLTDLMRRMYICEERSSGVDRVVHTVEQVTIRDEMM
ncbi:ATP-binding protein [Rhizobium subbaraonis]